jgi:hypothetical protein
LNPALAVRYEDLVAAPEVILQNVAERAGLHHFEPSERPDIRHVLSGNPKLQFEQGEIRINPDEAWRRMIPRWKQLLILAGGLPIASKYRYVLDLRSFRERYRGDTRR